MTLYEYFTPQEVESARKALESYLPIPFLRNFACTDPIKEGDASTNMTLQRQLETK